MMILKLIFTLPINIETLAKEAEQANLNNDDGLYINLASTIDIFIKNKVRNYKLSDFPWKTLIIKFRE